MGSIRAALLVQQCSFPAFSKWFAGNGATYSTRQGYLGKKVVNRQSLVFRRLRSGGCGSGLFWRDTRSSAYRYARPDSRSYGHACTHCHTGADGYSSTYCHTAASGDA